jgi:hypothetical protein
LALLVANARAADSSAAPKENVFTAKPLGIKLSIKMVAHKGGCQQAKKFPFPIFFLRSG